MKFIHLSDLHFHMHPDDNREIETTLTFVEKTYPNHFVVLTGDITDDGHPKQYENAQQALMKFKGRIFICPGNHDFGAAGNFYSQERAKRFDEFLSIPLEQGGTFTGDNTPVVNTLQDKKDRVALIALDTNLETIIPFDFACGQVGPEQLASLQTVLDDPNLAMMTKILFFHHHPFIHNSPFMELLDAKELMRTVYSKVKLVLFGHKHESKQWSFPNDPLYYIASDNSPGKNFAREVAIEKGKISISDIPIC